MRRNNNAAGGGPHQQSAVLRLFLPPSYATWGALPMNPLEGLPGAPPAHDTKDAPQKEDYKFYCDPCQKGFHTQGRYEEHMQDHIYCAVEGCHFTCRKSKQWKLELHMETLHNRPDAPQLQDVDAYLAQRKRRFPTNNTVQSKVEELFYKAARGEVLPDERRRWMRQHGVLIKKKRFRDETSFISSNALKAEGALAVGGPSSAADAEECPLIEAVAPMRKPTDTTEASSPSQPVAPPARRPKLVPEGPDGRLSKSQKVQLIRDKYRDATNVPRFYVCNRCGVKGEHWVASCPTLGDARFDRNSQWGEDGRASFQSHHHAVALQAADAPNMATDEHEDNVDASTALGDDATGASSVPMGGEDDVVMEQSMPSPCKETNANTVATAAADDENEGDKDRAAGNDGGGGEGTDELGPVEHDARDPPPASKQYVRTIQPVAAMRLKGRLVRARHPAPRQHGGVSLFSRLTEDDGVDDKGLLLQAFRFFVARNFFEDNESS